MYEDGGGVYCKLRLMAVDKEYPNYPHKYWRTDCYSLPLGCQYPEKRMIEPTGPIKRFIEFTLTMQQNNQDEWMLEFIKVANAMLAGLSDNERLRFNNGEVIQVGFE